MTAFAILALCICIGLQWADIETTNRVLDGNKGRESGFIKVAMRLLGRAWWIVKPLIFLNFIVLAWFLDGARGVLAASVPVALITAYGAWHNYRQLQIR